MARFTRNGGFESMPVNELIPILQIAIGPVILISGIGLILLSMTNRFGRVIDRSRELSHELRTASELERPAVLAQIEILSKRGVYVRRAVMLTILSLLFVAVLVITLFVSAILRLDLGLLIAALFVCCMGCLIGGLITFLRDINLSLSALQLELCIKQKPKS